jgi:hypothetical protein
MSDEAAKASQYVNSRKVALTRNDAKNFQEGPAYDASGGHPITKDLPKQEFKALQMPEPKQPPAGPPAPFTIKGT